MKGVGGEGGGGESYPSFPSEFPGHDLSLCFGLHYENPFLVRLAGR
jgi:hypothetical protein